MIHFTETLRTLKVHNPTLRDCFDPGSHEFLETTMQQKIDVLQKIISNNLSLEKIGQEYQDYFRSELKTGVAEDLSYGLLLLVNFLLTKHTSYRIAKLNKYSTQDLLVILSALLKDTRKLTLEVKEILYKYLVNERKEYRFRDERILNPSQLDIPFDDHLNAWSYWHHNLEAEILLIGQDFGDSDYYKKYGGKDNPANATNINLATLFQQLDIKTGTSDIPGLDQKLYFTNAVLGVKDGGMAAPVNKKWYIETAMKFIKPLIDIIQPHIIIAMGSKAYDVMSIIYSLPRKPMKTIVEQNPFDLPDNKKLFVVFHCSGLGIANRNFSMQTEDWKKIKSYL